MKKLLLLLVFLMAVACSNDNGNGPQTTPAPTLEIQQVPQTINPGKVYTVMVKVESESAVDSVRLDIGNDGSDVILQTEYLYDDGGAVHLDDGDVAARDDVFTQRIQLESTINFAETLEFSFTAEALSGQTSKAVEQSVKYAGDNAAPVVVSVEAPDELPSGFASVEFRVTVADSNGLDDITKTEFHAQKDDFEFTRELTGQGDGTFTLAVDSTFAIGLNGEFRFLFYAVDASGDTSNRVEQFITIENKAPRFLDIVHSDSVAAPPPESRVGALVQVLVHDDQSLDDVVFVRMEWKKPDGTYSQNSPFDLYDNGLPLDEENLTGWNQGYRGDITAGDGLYSITAMFDDDDLLGDYELTFYSQDFAGNKSERVTTTITLY